jgi:hypothetical protein
MSIEIITKRKRFILSLLCCESIKIFRCFAYFFAISFLFFTPSYAKADPKISEKTQGWSIEPHERKWLEKFFNDIMLHESAVYTLFGSKPMTMIVLDHTPEEKIQAIIEEMSEEEKKELFFLDEPYDLPDNWKKWEKISSRFPILNYLFFKKVREDNPLLEDVYFVNIRQTAFTIEENYELFKKYVDEDFDPLEAVFEIGDERSAFWKATAQNSTLLGILYGFGKKNAQCFDWKYWSYSEDNKPLRAFTDSLSFTFSSNIKEYKTVSLKHFGLPCFASFSSQGKDEIVKKYESERKAIQRHYKGKDFVAETLRKLTSE